MTIVCSICKAECEELAQRAEVLREENASLREEVEKVKMKQKELLAQNKALKVMKQSKFVHEPIKVEFFFFDMLHSKSPVGNNCEVAFYLLNNNVVL